MNRKYAYIMLILITAILTLFSPPEKAKADTYTDSYGKWTYSVNGSEATITKYYSVVSNTDISIPDIINGYPVTSIGDSAFYGCSSLKSITIPNSVTSIGDYAFIYCSSLASITIPNSVTSIGDYAFYTCSSLKSITIPNSVTSIGDCAFESCSSLASITIPNSVTSIGAAVFASCSKLTSIMIPNSVTNIGNSAFSGCSSVTSITIPNSVTSIGAHAFEYCSVTSITIPNSVTSIGNYAFNSCSSLTSITIANGNVTFGGNNVFKDCSKLDTINTYASSLNNNVSNYISANNLSSVILNATSPLTDDTVVASAATLTPNIMTSDSVTLTVKKSDGSVDTDFSGEHNVIISGVKKASDNTYGKFNGIDLNSDAALISTSTNPNYGQIIEKLNFVSGKATADLILNRAGNQSIEFYVEGVRNPLSNIININPKLIAPTGLIITAGDGKVDLSWNSVSDAESYKIYEGTQSGVYGTTPVKTVTAPTTSAAITGLANGTTYYFKINASKKWVSDSPNSSEVSAVPVVPITNFASTAKTSGTATFTWTAASGATGITIEQSAVGSSTWTTSVTMESTINVNAGTATVTGLIPGSSYKFRLVVTEGANAGNSNEVTVATDAVPITNFASTAKTSSTATFTWTAASGATGITIEQSAVGSNTWTTSVTMESTINVNAGTATVTGLTPGSSYKFRLVVTGGANAGNSNEVTVATDAAPITNFAITAKTSGTATFTWTAAMGATGITIEQSAVGSSTWTTSVTIESTINVNAGTATVTGLNPGSSYKFRLVVTGGANAGNSNEVTVAINAVPISDFRNTAKTSNTAAFAWTQVSGATGIVIEQSEGSSNIWTAAVTSESLINVGAGTATVTGLTPGSNYKFRLVVTGGANAGNSNEVVVSTNAVPILDFRNTTKTSSTAAFAWTLVSGATGIAIEQSEGSSNTWITAVTTESTINVNAVEATVTGLTSGSNYKFRLVVTGGANAGVSNEVAVTENTVPISDLRNTAKTSNTAAFAWTQASGATGIVIEQSEGSSNTWTTAVTSESSINVSSGAATVSGLTPGSNYRFRLVVTGGANGGNSNEVTVSTNAVPISNFRNTGKTSNTAAFAWTPTSGATGIVIEQSEAGSSIWRASVTTESSINVSTGTVIGLTPGSSYKFRLVVAGGANAGISNIVIVTLETAPPITPTTTPTPINDLASTVGDGQVTLNFTAPDGATGIVVQQSTNGMNYAKATTSSAITSASTSAVVTALTNGTTYNFRLVVTGGIHAGISNVTTATPIAVVTPIPPTPAITAAPSEANITVINNIEGVQDIITVTGLNTGDIVKVYDALVEGKLLGTGTAVSEQTSILINVVQLGANAGNVYVSVTSTGKIESLRTIKAYAQEIRNSSISVSVVAFDKNINKQADIDVYVNFNGNTLTGISNGSNGLVNGMDYVVNGNIITIKKSYLLNQELGNIVLDFNFSSGNVQAATVKIVNTTPIDLTGNDKDKTDKDSDRYSNGSEVRTIDIFAGAEGNGTSVKVEVKRTIVDGIKFDTVKLENSNIADAITKTLAANKTEIVIKITDLKDNPADVLEIQIPKTSAGKLAENGIGLEIYAPKAKLQISDETLKGISVDVKISIEEVTDKSKIDEAKAMVLEIFGDLNGEIKVLGNPVEVKANYTGKTEIIIPLNIENLPKDPMELKKLLDSLAVHVKHSNGEIVTEKGRIVYDEKRNIVGISISVDSFSTFTIVSLSKDDMDKLAANNGVISNRIVRNGSNRNSGDKNSESKLQNSQLPEIKFVGLGHSPLVEGDKEEFIISSSFDGKVQYRIFLNVDGIWQEVTNGYSEPVSGKDTFTLTPDYTFAKGQYQGRVYVKKAGVKGSNEENGIDFDNYYTYNINCVDRDDANRVYTTGKLVIDKETVKAGEKITITGIEGISGIPGPYYYRLHIYDVANDKWTNNVIPYSEKLEWKPSAAGTYVLDIHVITPNSVLWDKVQEDPTLIYGGYEGWKLKAIRVNN